MYYLLLATALIAFYWLTVFLTLTMAFASNASTNVAAALAATVLFAVNAVIGWAMKD